MAQGPLKVLPRAYYEERLKQADQYHWKVWTLINSLENPDKLAEHCQTKRRLMGGNRKDDRPEPQVWTDTPDPDFTY